MTIKLGYRYRDPVSGWEGVATAITRYVYGCERVSLEGVDKDGKPDRFTFDAPQLVLVEGGPVLGSDEIAKTGGPRGTVHGGM